jgi:FkbM family methyltransferase
MGYSQFGEDEYVFDTFFKTKSTPGVYFEAGAMNGIELSNTKPFQEMGWKGVLVEAMPDKYEALRKNRPRDACFQCILSDTSGETKTLNVDEKLPNVSSVAQNNAAHAAHWHNNSKTIDVRTKTLADILRFERTEYIDFFSLDIEGYELFALRGMDWNVRVGVWCIEMLGDKCHAVRSLLQAHGYRYHSNIHFNEIWIADETFKKQGRSTIRYVGPGTDFVTSAIRTTVLTFLCVLVIVALVKLMGSIDVFKKGTRRFAF